MTVKYINRKGESIAPDAQISSELGESIGVNELSPNFSVDAKVIEAPEIDGFIAIKANDILVTSLNGDNFLTIIYEPIAISSAIDDGDADSLISDFNNQAAPTELTYQLNNQTIRVQYNLPVQPADREQQTIDTLENIEKAVTQSNLIPVLQIGGYQSMVDGLLSKTIEVLPESSDQPFFSISYQPIDAEVQYNFVDIEGLTLHNAIINTGVVDQQIPDIHNEVTIDDYQFVETSNELSADYFLPGVINQVVYIYQPTPVEASVVYTYKDLSGNDLRNPEIVSAKIGAEIIDRIVDIPDYVYISRDEKNGNTVPDDGAVVNYFYEPNLHRATLVIQDSDSTNQQIDIVEGFANQDIEFQRNDNDLERPGYVYVVSTPDGSTYLSLSEALSNYNQFIDSSDDQVFEVVYSSIQQLSESASQSIQESLSQSELDLEQAMAILDSISELESLSESHQSYLILSESEFVSQQDSKQLSESESNSIYLQYSLRESESQSESESESISEYLQNSLSTSESEFISESEMTSIQNSLSTSESEFISESEMTSIQDSLSLSESESISKYLQNSLELSEYESESEMTSIQNSMVIFESNSMFVQNSLVLSELESQSSFSSIQDSLIQSESNSEFIQDSLALSGLMSESESSSRYQSQAVVESESISTSLQLSEDISESESLSESILDSISLFEFQSESESTQDSLIQSESNSEFIQDSLTLSELMSESESSADYQLQAFIQSESLSESTQDSISFFESESISSSTQDSISLSESESSSASMQLSQEISESESTQDSISESESESESTQDSISLSESESSSASMQLSQEISESESISESTQDSISESISESTQDSISLFEFQSESESTQDAISLFESESTSEFVQDSLMLSALMSESESLSTSSFESAMLSESASEQEVILWSEYQSTSIEDSLVLSESESTQDSIMWSELDFEQATAILDSISNVESESISIQDSISFLESESTSIEDSLSLNVISESESVNIFLDFEQEITQSSSQVFSFTVRYSSTDNALQLTDTIQESPLIISTSTQKGKKGEKVISYDPAQSYKFDDVIPKAFPGYKAVPDLVEGPTVSFGDRDIVVEVSYQPIETEAVVHFIDESGKAIKSDEIITGKTNTPIKSKPTDIAGYSFSEARTKDDGRMLFSGEDDQITFVYKPQARSAILYSATDPEAFEEQVIETAEGFVDASIYFKTNDNDLERRGFIYVVTAPDQKTYSNLREALLAYSEFDANSDTEIIFEIIYSPMPQKAVIISENDPKGDQILENLPGKTYQPVVSKLTKERLYRPGYSYQILDSINNEVELNQLGIFDNDPENLQTFRIVYSGLQQKVIVNYIDDQENSELNSFSQEISGTTNEKYTNQLYDFESFGYQLKNAPKEATSGVFPASDEQQPQIFEVHLTHKIIEQNEERVMNQITRFVDNQLSNNEIFESDEQSVNLVRITEIDAVTNNEVSQRIVGSKMTFSAVKFPKKKGYHFNPSKINQNQVIFGEDSLINVIVEPNDAVITYLYVNQDNRPIAESVYTDAKVDQIISSNIIDIPGYSYKEISADSDDTVPVNGQATVTYVYSANDVQVKVNFINQLDNSIIQSPQTLTGKTSQRINFNDSQFVMNGYSLNLEKSAKNDIFNPQTDELDEFELIYTPNTQTLYIDYIDETTNQTLIKYQQKISGKSDTEYQIPEFDDYQEDGYQLVRADKGAIVGKFDHLDEVDQHYNIYLNHKIDDSISERTVRFTVNFIDETGKKILDSDYQEFKFTRVRTIDLVTREILKVEYQPNETYIFQDVKVPSIKGLYTPDKLIKGETVNYDSDDIVVDATYAVQKRKAIVEYIDQESDELINSVEIVGDAGSAYQYTVKIPRGYKLNDDAQTKISEKFDDDTNSDQIHKIYLQHKKTKVTRTIIARRLISLEDVSGKKIAEDLVQELPIKMNGVRDEILGWRDPIYQPANPKFEAMVLPDIKGYKAVTKEVPEQNIEDPENKSSFTATYEKSEITVTVNYLDEAGNQIAPSVSLTGFAGESFDAEPKTIENYKLKRKPRSTKGKFDSNQNDREINYLYYPYGDFILKFVDIDDDATSDPIPVTAKLNTPIDLDLLKYVPQGYRLANQKQNRIKGSFASQEEVFYDVKHIKTQSKQQITTKSTVHFVIKGIRQHPDDVVQKMTATKITEVDQANEQETVSYNPTKAMFNDVFAPIIDGFKPNKAVVKGTIVDFGKDIETTITYNRDESKDN